METVYELSFLKRQQRAFYSLAENQLVKVRPQGKRRITHWRPKWQGPRFVFWAQLLQGACALLSTRKWIPYLSSPIPPCSSSASSTGSHELSVCVCVFFLDRSVYTSSGQRTIHTNSKNRTQNKSIPVFPANIWLPFSCSLIKEILSEHSQCRQRIDGEVLTCQSPCPRPGSKQNGVGNKSHRRQHTFWQKRHIHTFI